VAPTKLALVLWRVAGQPVFVEVGENPPLTGFV
jgi:hypothetical protein